MSIIREAIRREQERLQSVKAWFDAALIPSLEPDPVEDLALKVSAIVLLDTGFDGRLKQPRDLISIDLPELLDMFMKDFPNFAKYKITAIGAHAIAVAALTKKGAFQPEMVQKVSEELNKMFTELDSVVEAEVNTLEESLQELGFEEAAEDEPLPEERQIRKLIEQIKQSRKEIDETERLYLEAKQNVEEEQQKALERVLKEQQKYFTQQEPSITRWIKISEFTDVPSMAIEKLSIADAKQRISSILGLLSHHSAMSPFYDYREPIHDCVDKLREFKAQLDREVIDQPRARMRDYATKAHTIRCQVESDQKELVRQCRLYVRQNRALIEN